MEGTIEISAFMQHLEKNDLVIAPRRLVDDRIKLEKKRQQVLKKTVLSFREISEAQLWGEISVKSVKVHAKKYAKEGEILETSIGNKPQLKIIRAAVERIAKARGTWN